MNGSQMVRIESLGTYLPEQVLTMEDLLASCRRRPPWDLERITGIRERRVAVGEFAIDLAVQAARRALALSSYRAADLDVIICASISKHNRENEFQLEPATAALVSQSIGAASARVFDVVPNVLKEVQKIHDCPAVINEKSRKPAPLAKKPEEFETPNAEKGILDLNIREQAEKYPQFIRAISKRLKNRESAFVIWFHGIDDDDLSEQAAKLEGQDVLNCLIGYRKRPQSTGIQKGQSSVR